MAGNHYFDGKDYFVDTAFLNATRGVLPGFELHHLGMGEFVGKDGKGGEVEFDRMRGKDFPGQSGRSHKVYDNQKGKLVKKLMNAMEKKGKSKLQTEAAGYEGAELSEMQKLAGIRPKYQELHREAERPAMAANNGRPQGGRNRGKGITEALKLAGITPKYHEHLLDEGEQLGLPMKLGKRARSNLSGYLQPDLVDPKWSKGREPARQARKANVKTFIDIMKHKLIQKDAQDAKKHGYGQNKYQLAHWMGALQKIEKDVKRYMLVGGDDAMNALLKAMRTRFTYDRGKYSLAALNSVEKKIKKFMKDGKKPSTR